MGLGFLFSEFDPFNPFGLRRTKYNVEKTNEGEFVEEEWQGKDIYGNYKRIYRAYEIVNIDNRNKQRPLRSSEDKLSEISQKIKDAIDNENYEEAAELKKILDVLQKENDDREKDE